MRLVVQKFGGSSVASPERIRAVAKIIAQTRKKNTNVVVVVSAMGKMTDELIQLAKRTVDQVPQRELDMLLTAGERVSMSLLAMALQQEGVPAISFTGSQSGIITTSKHTEAKIIEVKAFRIQQALEEGKVVIVAGFQGVSREKEITTLGRGGSDTTAVALAAYLKAECCEIFTDVAGLFTADPKVIPSARRIPKCSYDLAIEFAALGAKMHPHSIALAKRHKIRLRVCSSFEPDRSGTLIEENVTDPPLLGIAIHRQRKLVRTNLSGINFDDEFSPLKSQSGDYLICTDKELIDLGVSVVSKDVGLVSVVGNLVGDAEPFLNCLASTGIEPDWVDRRKKSLICAVPVNRGEEVVRLLYERFFSIGDPQNSNDRAPARA